MIDLKRLRRRAREQARPVPGWAVRGTALYDEVAAGFDRVAHAYDRLAGGNPALALMRRRSVAVLLERFPPGSRLIELGCGTGEEAVALARAGRSVLATDVSERMVAIAAAKAAQAGVADRVETRVLPAGRLLELAQSREAASFDGAYSSFGPLNCEPELADVAYALRQLLRPGARLVATVMGNKPLFEIVWHLAHLRPRQAFRRMGRPWRPASVGGDGQGVTLGVPVRYYSPRRFAEHFKPYFISVQIEALPLFLPPPYLAHLYERFPGICATLASLDERLAEVPLLNALGDHFLIELELRRG